MNRPPNAPREPREQLQPNNTMTDIENLYNRLYKLERQVAAMSPPPANAKSIIDNSICISGGDVVYFIAETDLRRIQERLMVRTLSDENRKILSAVLSEFIRQNFK